MTASADNAATGVEPTPAEVESPELQPTPAAPEVEEDDEATTGETPEPSILAEFPSCSGQLSSYILRVYSRSAGGPAPSGYSSMRCGTTVGNGYGLRHIEHHHASQWQHKADYIRTTWEDLLDGSVAQTLAGPSQVTYRSNNNTYKYVAPIQLWAAGPLGPYLVNEFNTNVIVAAQDGKIISAYPSNL